PLKIESHKSSTCLGFHTKPLCKDGNFILLSSSCHFEISLKEYPLISIYLILIIQIYSKNPQCNMCTGFCISQSVVMIFECKSQILRNGVQLMIRKFRKKLLCFSIGTKKRILMFGKPVSSQNSF